jgi:hypothetical protein
MPFCPIDDVFRRLSLEQAESIFVELGKLLISAHCTRNNLYVVFPSLSTKPAEHTLHPLSSTVQRSEEIIIHAGTRGGYWQELQIAEWPRLTVATSPLHLLRARKLCVLREMMAPLRHALTCLGFGS